MKKYIRPFVKIRTIQADHLLAASINGQENGNVSFVEETTITDKTEVGSKWHYSVWDEDE